VSYAGVEVGRVKREEKLSVICIEVVVQRQGGYKSTEKSGVHDKEQRTENRAVRNATGGGVHGRQNVIAFHTEGATDYMVSRLAPFLLSISGFYRATLC